MLTPAVAPPAFTRLDALNTTIDEQQGTFSAGITAGLDRPGQVFYAVYRWVGGTQGLLLDWIGSALEGAVLGGRCCRAPRPVLPSICLPLPALLLSAHPPHRNYSCITGEPSVADVVAGAALPPAVCGCADRSYCALVAAGSFGVPAQVGAPRQPCRQLPGMPGCPLLSSTPPLPTPPHHALQALNATHAIGGDVSPLPFESLRGAGDDELKCFLGGLGEASDTFNVNPASAAELWVGRSTEESGAVLGSRLAPTDS